ncbi:MAG: DUF1573 domain-containing protein [Verrucomicrobiota bacterium]
MRVVYRSLLLALSGVSLLAPLRASLVWEKKEIEVPAALGQLELEGKYRFTNTGDTPVTVLDVRTNCGCTYAAASQQVVAPGESAEIVAFFDQTQREGPQRSIISVRTDDASEPVILIFGTDIPRLLTLPTRVVIWDVDEPLLPRELTLEVMEGVRVSLPETPNPLPIAAQLKQDAEKDSLILVLTPLNNAPSNRGLLLLKASWNEEVSRTYQIYVRVEQG